LFRKNDHCSFCGLRFPDESSWPRTCSQCQQRTYLNPLPVAVALVPIAGGLLTVRRSIPPRIGDLALPGGFIDMGEGWREAVVRELYEETGITLPAMDVQFFESFSSSGGHLLIFGQCPELPTLPAFLANSEVSELVVIDQPIELAFPLHTQAMQRWFANRKHLG